MTSHRWAVGAALLSAAATGASPAALAQPLVPPQEAVCVPSGGGGRIIDKRALARWLLNRSAINVLAVEDRLSAPTDGLDLSRRVVSDRSICAGNSSCSSSDRESSQRINATFDSLMTDGIVGYRHSVRMSQAQWFTTGNELGVVRCLSGPGGEPIVPPGSTASQPRPWTTSIRLRGRVDELQVPRTSITQFRATTPAVASVGADDTAGSTTLKASGVVGYGVDLSPWLATLGREGQAESLEVIPYFSIDRSVTRLRNRASPAETSLYGVGATLSAFLVTPLGTTPIGHRIEFRPDLLLNAEDESQLLSANLRYVPYASLFDVKLNDFRPLFLDEQGTPRYWVAPLADVRVSTGRYVARGDSIRADAYDDFLRVGGQIGLALISDVTSLPLEFRTTYTWMPDTLGTHDVGYFSNALTWSLDENKYIGVTLKYVNGTREDNARREQSWSLGLSVRF